MPDLTLTTDRLTLRPVSHEDAEAALEVLSSPEMTTFSGLPTIQTAQEAWDFVNGMVAYNESGQGIALGIHTDTQLVGFIRFMEIDRDKGHATLNFEIGKAHWNNGYATEAVREMLRYGVATYGITTVTANIHPMNHASRRVMEKCGIG